MSEYDADRHAIQHRDRTGDSTRYVEVCWKCAEDWLAYVKEHGWRGDPNSPVVLAMRPAAGEPE